MKRKISIWLCVFLVFAISCTAYAAVQFKSFRMTLGSSTSVFYSIVTDSTSKQMAANTGYARLYLTSTVCEDMNFAPVPAVNSVYHADLGNKTVTGDYRYKTTSGTWMYYKQTIPIYSNVTLRGRPDSTVYVATVTGSFGAG